MQVIDCCLPSRTRELHTRARPSTRRPFAPLIDSDPDRVLCADSLDDTASFRRAHVRSLAMGGDAGGGNSASYITRPNHNHQVRACGALCHTRSRSERADLSMAGWSPDCSDRDSDLYTRWQAMAGGAGDGVGARTTARANHDHQVRACGALCHARLRLAHAALPPPVWCCPFSDCSDRDSDLYIRWQAMAGGAGDGVGARTTAQANHDHQVRACSMLCHTRLRSERADL